MGVKGTGTITGGIPLAGNLLYGARQRLSRGAARAREGARDASALAGSLAGRDSRVARAPDRAFLAAAAQSLPLLRNLPEADNPAVLFAVIGAGADPAATAAMALLAVALRLRGTSAATVACDAALPSCSADPLGNRVLPVPPDYDVSSGRDTCRTCRRAVHRTCGLLPLPRKEVGARLCREDVNDAILAVNRVQPRLYPDLRHLGVPVGAHAVAAVRKVPRNGNPAGGHFTTWLVRRHLVAGILSAEMAVRLLDGSDAGLVVLPAAEGIEYGVFVDVAKKHGVPLAVLSVKEKERVLVAGLHNAEGNPVESAPMRHLALLPDGVSTGLVLRNMDELGPGRDRDMDRLARTVGAMRAKRKDKAG